MISSLVCCATDTKERIFLRMNISRPPDFLFAFLFIFLQEITTSLLYVCLINSHSSLVNHVSTRSEMSYFIKEMISLCFCFHLLKPLMFQLHSVKLHLSDSTILCFALSFLSRCSETILLELITNKGYIVSFLLSLSISIAIVVCPVIDRCWSRSSAMQLIYQHFKLSLDASIY